jgi:hypothetical protein
LVLDVPLVEEPVVVSIVLLVLFVAEVPAVVVPLVALVIPPVLEFPVTLPVLVSFTLLSSICFFLQLLVIKTEADMITLIKIVLNE